MLGAHHSGPARPPAAGPPVNRVPYSKSKHVCVSVCVHMCVYVCVCTSAYVTCACALVVVHCVNMHAHVMHACIALPVRQDVVAIA